MGIAFDYGPVHECTGVSFIGITDNIFLFTLFVSANLPFESCGKSCPASSPEPGFFHNQYRLLRGHRGKGLPCSLITTNFYVGIDIFRVYLTTVRQYYLHLFFMKIKVIFSNSPFFDRITLQNVLTYYPRNHTCFYLFVGRLVIIYNYINEHILSTKSKTTHLMDRTPVFQSGFYTCSVKLLIKCLYNIGCTFSDSSRTHADLYLYIAFHFVPLSLSILSISLRRSSSEIFPQTLSLTRTTGAILNVPSQATSSIVNFLSAVVSFPSGRSNLFLKPFKNLSEPLIWQAVPVQTVITSLPLGLR